jgi:hypothetical protein
MTGEKQDHADLEPLAAGEIRRELETVLASSSFRASKRCHDFLHYVVTKSLSGDADSLKERTIAVQVFGRKADADLGEDSIVRVGAREVRKRLAQYYVNDGARDNVRIDLHAGSYHPLFHFRSGVAVGEERVAPAPPPPIAVDVPAALPPGTRVWWRWVAGALILGAAAAVAWRLTPRGEPAEFEAFWHPAFSQQTPLLIAMAHPIVYHPSERLIDLDEQKNGVPTAQRAINVTAESLKSPYVPVFDQYVGFGDAVAASKVSVLFAQHSRQVRIQLSSKMDFAETRDSPALLIGAFTNRWTMEVAQGLRYRFAMSGIKPWIVDSVTGQQWKLDGKTDSGRSNDDYLVVARLIHSQTGGFLVIGAGLTQYGTEEAGRILTDPAVLVPLLQKLPAIWRTRNVELVLHSRVMADTPTQPDLVASYLW